MQTLDGSTWLVRRQGGQRCATRTIDFSSTISPLRDTSISGPVAARVFKRANLITDDADLK